MSVPADPILARAVRLAHLAYARAASSPPGAPAVRPRHGDELAEVVALALAALEHLDAGRWDEARAAGDAALELAEELGEGARWREFALRVEEASATALP